MDASTLHTAEIRRMGHPRLLPPGFVWNTDILVRLLELPSLTFLSFDYITASMLETLAASGVCRSGPRRAQSAEAAPSESRAWPALSSPARPPLGCPLSAYMAPGGVRHIAAAGAGGDFAPSDHGGSNGDAACLEGRNLEEKNPIGTWATEEEEEEEQQQEEQQQEEEEEQPALPSLQVRTLCLHVPCFITRARFQGILNVLNLSQL